MTQSEDYARARKRAEAKYGFLVHLGVFAAVMSLLLVINLSTSPGELWFVWPLIGWGFAVAIHGVRVYLLADKNAVLDSLTEQKLQKFSNDRAADAHR